jgi:hypothetical protein
VLDLVERGDVRFLDELRRRAKRQELQRKPTEARDRCVFLKDSVKLSTFTLKRMHEASAQRNG